MVSKESTRRKDEYTFCVVRGPSVAMNEEDVIIDRRAKRVTINGNGDPADAMYRAFKSGQQLILRSKT